MTNVLAAGVLAAVLSVLLGPRFITILGRLRFGQNIRGEGPSGHQTKQGTPTMGGILLVLATTIGFLAFSKRNLRADTALLAILGCALIGWLDDWRKVVKKRSLGLRGRYKLLGQGLVALGISLVATYEGLSTIVFVPIVEWKIDFGLAWYGLVFAMVLGASNAVNLTDGLDGLAATTSAIAALAYTGIGVVSYQVSLLAVRRASSPAGLETATAEAASRLDIAVLAAALLGACTGFLWFNAFPAQLFMGDTGSLALGGAFAALAVFTKTELLLVLIGAVFVLEALSVIIQVVWFKRTGRRVFLMAPIHHQFEMQGWSETRIMVRFAIIASVSAASAFVLYYLRADQYG